jgi:hypothetical protein
VGAPLARGGDLARAQGTRLSGSLRTPAPATPCELELAAREQEGATEGAEIELGRPVGRLDARPFPRPDQGGETLLVGEGHELGLSHDPAEEQPTVAHHLHRAALLRHGHRPGSEGAVGTLHLSGVGACELSGAGAAGEDTRRGARHAPLQAPRGHDRQLPLRAVRHRHDLLRPRDLSVEDVVFLEEGAERPDVEDGAPHRVQPPHELAAQRVGAHRTRGGHDLGLGLGAAHGARLLGLP